jgi:hypothetical protein
MRERSQAVTEKEDPNVRTHILRMWYAVFVQPQGDQELSEEVLGLSNTCSGLQVMSLAVNLNGRAAEEAVNFSIFKVSLGSLRTGDE